MFEQEHFQYKDIIFFINRKRKTNQLNKNYCKLLGVDYKRKQQRRPQAEAVQITKPPTMQVQRAIMYLHNFFFPSSS
jgi:hypothetical protein